MISKTFKIQGDLKAESIADLVSNAIRTTPDVKNMVKKSNSSKKQVQHKTSQRKLESNSEAQILKKLNAIMERLDDLERSIDTLKKGQQRASGV